MTKGDPTMASLPDSWKRTLRRALVVMAAGILVGFIFYDFGVFIPTWKASQFTISSITIGITYAALKSSRPRNGLAALFVLYIVTVGLLVPFNWWLLILDFAYIAGMAGVVYLHQRVVTRPIVRGPLMRIALGGVLVSLANALIIVVLSLFNFRVWLARMPVIVGEVRGNLQFGALIGLATASGMELAEYWDGKLYSAPDEGDDITTPDASASQ
jgi:hypothetical protein